MDTYSGVWSPNTDGPLRQHLEPKTPKGEEHGCLGGDPGGSAVPRAPVPPTPCCRRSLSPPGVSRARCLRGRAHRSASLPPGHTDYFCSQGGAGPAASSTAWTGLGWPRGTAACPPGGSLSPCPGPGMVPWSESGLGWPLGAPPRGDRGQAGWAGSPAASAVQRQACAKAPSDQGAQAGHPCVYVSVRICMCVCMCMCLCKCVLVSVYTCAPVTHPCV